MRCATCGNPDGAPLSITPNVHEGCCASCVESWKDRAWRESELDMQRPSFALAEYRRWQAWRRATNRPMPVPREVCAQ